MDRSEPEPAELLLNNNKYSEGSAAVSLRLDLFIFVSRLYPGGSDGFSPEPWVQILQSEAGLGSFCMKSCISAAWHGSAEVLEHQIALLAAFRSSASSVLVSLILTSENPVDQNQQTTW